MFKLTCLHKDICDTEVVNYFFDHFVIMLLPQLTKDEGIEQWIVYFAVSLLFSIKSSLMACQRVRYSFQRTPILTLRKQAEEVRTAIYLNAPKVTVDQIRAFVGQHFHRDPGFENYANNLAAADSSTKYWKPADADVISLDERDLVQSENLLNWNIKYIAEKNSKEKRVRIQRLMKSKSHFLGNGHSHFFTEWRRGAHNIILALRFIEATREAIMEKKGKKSGMLPCLLVKNI